MQRLVQLRHPTGGRRRHLGGRKQPLSRHPVIFDLPIRQERLADGKSLAEILGGSALLPERLKYDPVYSGQSDWKLLPSFDHPAEPSRCLVTGTGLTHKASAENRQSMHGSQTQPLTDSMRMYQSGLEGGRPRR